MEAGSCPGHRYPTIATVEQELLMGPTPPSSPPGWFEGQNMVACGYPECCGDPNATQGCHKPSKYPLLLLGNISTGVKTAADCEKLCLGVRRCLRSEGGHARPASPLWCPSPLGAVNLAHALGPRPRCIITRALASLIRPACPLAVASTSTTFRALHFGLSTTRYPT